ncbi:WecB/TagA/CpsF family glycosyltransferase, partial [Pseudanabaenaceae cyanobacterium LEGE 13415]|nr:WecB/TagA/CpsF family glycosyltransferase [Pseudanabaenaceae cyanobacterium LEGE 13415]
MCRGKLVAHVPYSESLQPFSVLGLPMHLVNDYDRWLTHRIEQRLGCHVITLNAEMTMQAEQTPALANIIHQAELVIPDGSGIVFYMRLHGKRVKRIPGIELAQNLLERSAQFGEPWSIFFFGGAPGVADTAAENWRQQVPGISIIGTQNGYLKPEDEPEFLQQLKTLQPRLIYVG